MSDSDSDGNGAKRRKVMADTDDEADSDHANGNTTLKTSAANATRPQLLQKTVSAPPCGQAAASSLHAVVTTSYPSGGPSGASSLSVNGNEGPLAGGMQMTASLQADFLADIDVGGCPAMSSSSGGPSINSPVGNGTTPGILRSASNPATGVCAANGRGAAITAVGLLGAAAAPAAAQQRLLLGGKGKGFPLPVPASTTKGAVAAQSSGINQRVLRSTTARALAMQQQQLQQFHYSQQSSSHFNPPLKAPDRSGVNRQTKAKQNDVSSDEYTPEDSSSDEDYAHANASNKSLKQQQKRDEERRQWQQSVEKMRRTANSLALLVQQNFAENKTQAAQLRVKKAISKGRTNLLTNFCDPYAGSSGGAGVEEEVSCLPAEVLASYAKLKDYQKAGVRWLKTVTDAGFGGILADEMGLGKTAQTLTFLALQRSSCNVGPGSTATAATPAAPRGTPASGSSTATSSTTSSKPPLPSTASADGRRKPVLIVAPVTLLRNWELEAAKWTPHLRVFRYHSSSQKERWDLGLRYFAAEDAAKRRAAAAGTPIHAQPYDIVLTTAHCLANRDDRKMFFMQIKFSYFIIDEAHYLKTNTTKRVQEMHKIKAERRVLLTGTPIQNSLSELCNLLWFCTPSVFQPLTELDTTGAAAGTGGGKAAKEQTKQSRQWVQNMSSAFLLRRLKGDVLKDLPEKRVRVMCCELTAEQRKLYNAEIDLAIGKGTSSASGAGGTSGSGLYSTSSTSSLSSDDGDRALLKDDAAAGGEAMANGVKSLDALPKASPRVSGNGGFGNGQVMRLMGEQPPGPGPSAGTRQKKKAQAGASSNNEPKGRANEQQHNTVNITASRFKTIFSRLRRICGAPLMAQTKFGPLQYRCLAQLLQTKRDDFAKAGLERTEKTVRDWSDFEVHQAAKTFRLPPPFFASADEITSGGKIQQLLQVLTNRSHKKTLVFSQYTQFLDVIEEALRLKGFRFVRLDGSTASEDRQQLVDDFSSEANVNETDTKSRLSDSSKSIQVFLLSTRAGGVGLNLVAADMVILMDMDYNPQNNRQAEDRIHRLGQTNSVTILYFFCPGTLEEKVLEINLKKLKLDETFGGDGSGKLEEAMKTNKSRGQAVDITDSARTVTVPVPVPGVGGDVVDLDEQDEHDTEDDDEDPPEEVEKEALAELKASFLEPAGPSDTVPRGFTSGKVRKGRNKGMSIAFLSNAAEIEEDS